mgnify:CR=1 FL=1
MLCFVKFYPYDTKLYYLKSRICHPPYRQNVGEIVDQ